MDQEKHHLLAFYNFLTLVRQRALQNWVRSLQCSRLRTLYS